MRITRFTTLLLFAALAVVGLAACDQGEQNYEIEPGDSLNIRGPSSVTVPAGQASFNVFPYTIEKEYNWSVEGPGNVTTSTRRGGEFLDVTFEEPGTYTITIESSGQGDNYSGTLAVTASYTDVASQASRLGFGRLATALGAAGLADTLGTGGPFTLLAPTDEALVAAFDTTDAGELMLPADSVLTDILQYHAVTDSLPSGQIGDGQMAGTLEGSNVTFNVSGGTITVEDDSTGTEDATITDPNIPASNGLIHGIDGVLFPSSD